MLETLSIHFAVFRAFLRNAWVRELTFRANFFITLVTRGCWFAMQVFLFDTIYRQVPLINDWSREEYFVFMATGMLINSVVEAFFMPNCANFSELIRTGNLDFVLLKPIDPQFVVSFEKIDLAMLSQVALAGSLLAYALTRLDRPISWQNVLLYLVLVSAAVAFFYSLMLALAATSVFFGRNQGLLDFWFYVTVFARYPATIYSGSPAGEVVRFVFSYVLPILLVVTIPARVLGDMVVEPGWVAGFTVATGLAALLVSRLIFLWSITRYRSVGG